MKNIKKWGVWVSRFFLYALFVPVLLAYLGILALYLFDPDFFRIDDCLDRGGRWDYALEECVFQETE